jgi:hypothetical protein
MQLSHLLKVNNTQSRSSTLKSHHKELGRCLLLLGWSNGIQLFGREDTISTIWPITVVQFLGKSLDTKRAKAHLRVFYTLIHSTTMAQRVPLKAIDGNRGYKQELSVWDRAQISAFKAVGLINEQICGRVFCAPATVQSTL